MTDSKWLHLIDAGAWMVIGSSIVGWLPPLAAFVALVWNGIQIYTYVSNKLKRKTPGS